MKKVVPHFINIFFRPYCEKCKDPKIFIGDHRNESGSYRVTIYCEKSDVCENLIKYLKKEMDERNSSYQEAKDKKEEIDEQSNSKDE